MTYKYTYGEVRVKEREISFYLDREPSAKLINANEEYSRIIAPLTELNILSEQGWDVYAVTTDTDDTLIYHMRKESGLHGI